MLVSFSLAGFVWQRISLHISRSQGECWVIGCLYGNLLLTSLPSIHMPWWNENITSSPPLHTILGFSLILAPFPHLPNHSITSPSAQEVRALVQGAPERCWGLIISKHCAGSEALTDLWLTVASSSKGQLLALLHVNDQSLCLLLVLQKKAIFRSQRCSEITAFTIDAHHAANRTLKDKTPT